jgi:hypothetical protein
MRALSDISFLPDQCGADSLFAVWAWRIPEGHRPILLSLFGDWFLANPRGRIHMFDLLSGEVRPIADSEDEFFSMLEIEERRRDWLRSHLVDAIEQAGIKRSASQCFAFRTPPILGGTLAPSNVVPWDFAAYQTGTSKLLQQVLDVPVGTRVVVRGQNMGDA